MKKYNKYNLQLKQIEAKKEEDFNEEILSLDFENHDDIFHIIQIMKEKNHFENENQSVEFALGLKLFSEVMLKNRNNPLFQDFAPAFGDFMTKLKGK